jgi:hypothetical protein
MGRVDEERINMSSFYIANAGYLNQELPGVSKWHKIYNMIGVHSTLVDRCESMQMPYNFKLYEPFKMPRDLTGFNKTYEQCCEERTKELVDLSRHLDKPITVFYSGGIDSTLVLINFMKYLDREEFQSRIRVALSMESINENANFYYDYVRPLCNIVSSDNINNMFDGSTIIVGGEINDQLFGSDIIGNIYRVNNGLGEMNKPYTREHVLKWFKNFMDEPTSNMWFDMLDNHIKTQAPCEVSTNFHFWWWLNFSFKWQNVFFRMIVRINKEHRKNITPDFIKNYFHHFYTTEDFQRWSMLNHDLKIKNSWPSYKWEAKQLIYEFNRDEIYRDEKVKIGSLGKLFLQKSTPKAITSNFEFLDDIPDLSAYYNPNNGFI